MIFRASNQGPSANDYYNGAKFFADNTSEYEMALEWIDIAIRKTRSFLDDVSQG